MQEFAGRTVASRILKIMTKHAFRTPEKHKCTEVYEQRIMSDVILYQPKSYPNESENKST